MIILLRVVFIVILLAMLAVTSWASSIVALWKTPSEVVSHPWFIATLFDAYFGFITFWLWVAYKETSVAARILWLVLILLLGNIAMAIYMLIKLFKLPANATMAQLLLRKGHDHE